MTFTRIQKRIFHSKPPDATFTSKGKRAFSYNLAGALRHFAIDPNTWEETASYRKAWRSAISAKGTEYYMEKWLAERRIARQHRRDNEVARAHRRAARAVAEEEERAREEEATALRARLLANPIAEGIAMVQHGEERRIAHTAEIAGSLAARAQQTADFWATMQPEIINGTVLQRGSSTAFLTRTALHGSIYAQPQAPTSNAAPTLASSPPTSVATPQPRPAVPDATMSAEPTTTSDHHDPLEHVRRLRDSHLHAQHVATATRSENRRALAHPVWQLQLRDAH
jgi:hypothetical protein